MIAQQGSTEIANTAGLIVVDPSGHRTRVEIKPLPFRIGRQADNHLILRDSRTSRSHARIVAEGGMELAEELEVSGYERFLTTGVQS